MDSIQISLPYRIATHLGGLPPQEFRCDLEWHPADPAAVKATFHWTPQDRVEWTLSRSLLAEGMCAFVWTGEGDVAVRNFNAHQLLLRLASAEGRATIIMPIRPVEDFLAETESVIATGSSDEDERMAVWFELVLDEIMKGTE